MATPQPTYLTALPPYNNQASTPFSRCLYCLLPAVQRYPRVVRRESLAVTGITGVMCWGEGLQDRTTLLGGGFWQVLAQKGRELQ